MRRINKYKLYRRISVNLLKTPAKICQFRASKWSKAIDTIQNDISLIDEKLKKQYFIRKDIGKLKRIKTFKQIDPKMSAKVKYSMLRTKFLPDSFNDKECFSDNEVDLNFAIEKKLSTEKENDFSEDKISAQLKVALSKKMLNLDKQHLLDIIETNKEDFKENEKVINEIDFDFFKQIDDTDKKDTLEDLENLILEDREKKAFSIFTDLSIDNEVTDINDYQKCVDINENSLIPLFELEERTYSSTVYKESKLLKNYLELLYGAPVKIKSKHSFSTKYTIDAYRYYIFRHFLRVDVLLNLLCRFCSTYQAAQFINNKIILVNNRKVKKNYYLKKGDIITVPSSYSLLLSKISVKASTKYMAEELYFTPFLEFDPISNIIIILKDYKELDYADMCWLFDKPISLNHLLYKK